MPDQLTSELDTEAFISQELELWLDGENHPVYGREEWQDYIDRRFDERAGQRGHY